MEAFIPTVIAAVFERTVSRIAPETEMQRRVKQQEADELEEAVFDMICGVNVVVTGAKEQQLNAAYVFRGVNQYFHEDEEESTCTIYYDKWWKLSLNRKGASDEYVVCNWKGGVGPGKSLDTNP